MANSTRENPVLGGVESATAAAAVDGEGIAGVGQAKLSSMNFYGAKDLARQFRTVRANTIKIAEEIPEDKYSFKPAEDTRTVAQLLTHIATGARFNMKLHGEDKAKTLAGYDFMSVIGPLQAEEQKTRGKAELVGMLKAEGEKFAEFLEPLNEGFLAEMVEMPPGGDQGAGNASSWSVDADDAADGHGAALNARATRTDGRYGRRREEVRPPCTNEKAGVPKHPGIARRAIERRLLEGKTYRRRRRSPRLSSAPPMVKKVDGSGTLPGLPLVMSA
jgi:uncharacterized damage-inducible protein DinB